VPLPVKRLSIFCRQPGDRCATWAPAVTSYKSRSGFRVRARPGLGDPWSMCSTCKPPHDHQLIRQASDSCRRPESPGRIIKVPQAAGIRLVTESWSCCNSIRHGDVMCVARSIPVNVLHTAASTIKVLGSQFPSPARQACYRFSFIH
jgi:hypothetical protein